MLQAAFDFEGAASAPPATPPPASRRRGKPIPVPTAAPTTWMVTTLDRIGEPVWFLSADNYHHDRPDDAPTGLTGDPRRSPRFGSIESAERAIRRFRGPSGAGWGVQFTDDALMHPSVVLAFLGRAGLPHQVKTWGLPDEVGTFAIETSGRVGRDLTLRVTYSHSDREFSTLHLASNILGRCYRANLESVSIVDRAGRECGSMATAVRVSGVLPHLQWLD